MNYFKLNLVTKKYFLLLNFLLFISLAGFAQFQTGDVFVSVASGQVKRYTPTGTLLQTLNTTLGGFTTGMAIDATGNLYVTNFSVNAVSKFNTSGVLQGTFGTGYSTPESILFDAAGNAYVGNLGNGIRKYDATGAYLGTSYAGRVDFMALTADQCTMLRTTESTFIGSHNVCTNTINANFANGLGGSAFDLRIRPNGEVLVANGINIKRLDASGSVLQTYTVGGENSWFAINLAPDGTSFWSANFNTSNVYRIDIATGNVLSTFNTGTGSGTVFGLAVFGEIIVGGGGCNLSLTNTKTDVNCFGAATGAIALTATGGTAPVTFDWADLAGTNDPEDRTGLVAGTYTVIATDASGCSSTLTETINEPSSAVSCTITVNPSPTIAGHAANTIYRGYGAQSVTLTAAGAGGTSGYTFDWGSAGTGAVITVSPLTTTTYTATVTDASGCTSTCSVVIYVVDVRCGKNLDKVLVCHKDPKKGLQPLCVSQAETAIHLAHGDMLGVCAGVTARTRDIEVVRAPNDRDIDRETLIFPNPSNTDFKLRLNSKISEKVLVRVLDIYNNVVEVYSTTSDRISFKFGENYKAGIYYVIITKGNETKTIKLTKNL